MIEGLVNSALEAMTILRIEGPSGRGQEIEVLIDTGYSGYLTLPADFVMELGLLFIGEGQAILADGARARFDVFDAIVIWGGQAEPVEVDATGVRPLIGMSLLHRHGLYVEVVEGGRVGIEGIGELAVGDAVGVGEGGVVGLG